MDVFKFKSLSKFKNIKHGISTRDFGSMKNDDNPISREGLSNFLKILNIPFEGVTMEQTHGRNVEVVNDKSISRIDNTDGLITNMKNIPLCVVVADCLPVMFSDPKKEVIGIAHAGRKGLIRGIIKNMIDKFKSEYHSEAEDILVVVGPGIEKKCYEVDGQFVDIRTIANDQLIESGIEKENIENIDLCTKCNPDLFFSYRNGDSTGRFAGVICLI